MKKVVLVNVSKGFAKELMPLGLASIATYMRQHDPSVDIRILDANCQDIYNAFTDGDIVGIGAVTQDIHRAVHYAEFIRGRSKAKLILGGVHVSTHRTLPEPFDIGVIGEGEATMLELSSLAEFAPAELKKVKGICYKEDSDLVFTEDRDLIHPLDLLPIPDRDFFDIGYYMNKVQIIPYHTGISLTILTSRGCPFKCVFCSTSVHWKKLRSFSAERVIEEIELLIKKYKAEIVHIFDDLFIADKKRFLKIHKLIVEKGLNKIKYMCLVRADLLDDSMMQMLKEMNVVVTGVGMESGSDRMIKYLKKDTSSLEENERAIELSTKYKIPTMGSFMIGSPHETEDDLRQTLEFIRKFRRNPYFSPLVYVASAFPGTELWSYAKNKGINVEDYDKIVMDLPGRKEDLIGAPILSSLPLDVLYEFILQFKKESNYGHVRTIFYQNGRMYQKAIAYLKAIYVEGGIIPGLEGIREIKRRLYSPPSA
jgi:anaerobic magnesium-protoporphyrin IX monomethyl ester cyclase